MTSKHKPQDRNAYRQLGNVSDFLSGVDGLADPIKRPPDKLDYRLIKEVIDPLSGPSRIVDRQAHGRFHRVPAAWAFP